MKKLKYTLNEKKFDSEEDFKKAIKLVKIKKISINDIRLLIDNDIILFYNDLKKHFPKSIYKKVNVKNYILKNYSRKYIYYFQVLLKNNIIDVCGSGYRF